MSVPRRAPHAPAAAAARSPLMEQYASIKQSHPDAFLFFRLGDFYEMFFDDAVRGSHLLGLTLTSRNKQDAQPIPMCGLPWHQRDVYVARLLRLGHKVAVCDQLEEATQAKGLVQRGVTEVITPGSVVTDSFLDPAANNFLAALWPAPGSLGLCLADASTAEVQLAEPTWEEATGLLSRLKVSEWVVPGAGTPDPALAGRLASALAGLAGARTPLDPERFREVERVHARWRHAAPWMDELPAALAAAAGALEYLDRVQGGVALPLPRIERLGGEETLRYDAATARHLELFEPQGGGEARHTLWHHVNLSVTALGARRVRAWLERPLGATREIVRRQDAVQAWLEAGSARARFREALRGLPDLERLSSRLACARATPRDLGALRDTLARLPQVAATIPPRQDNGAEPVEEITRTPPELLALLRQALTDDPPPVSTDGGVIRREYDPLRDQFDDLAHSGKRWVAELEAAERTRTGIPSLKVGYNRVFGYYLEITRPHLSRVPSDYERRQTLTSAERFITPDLKTKESEILSAEERLRAREQELFVALRERAATHVSALLLAARALGQLDAEAAFAEAAARYEWSRPLVDESDRLLLEGARHPVVERLLPRGEFVPNDLSLDGRERQILLLTGPNMGGKSTYLRQSALIVLLAQAGSFVPATRAVIGRVDRLFTRVGAADRLGAGQSTFMVEMSETADILRSATPRSLVLLDEIGRGTATYDGLALAWAVTEYLHAAEGPRPRTLFATHYHELTQLSERLPRLANLHVTVKERGDTVVFLHRIAEGPADRSYGIHVAMLAGLPAAVITRAREVLGELESERTVEHLEARARGGPRAKASDSQLGLFAPAPHPAAEALRALEVEGLTPLEALNLLARWKKEWGSGG